MVKSGCSSSSKRARYHHHHALRHTMLCICKLESLSSKDNETKYYVAGHRFFSPSSPNLMIDIS
jgi:hypothetical protein